MKEHGSYSMETTGQILVLRACGAWNIETALRWSQDYLTRAETIKHQPWSCLVDLTKWDFNTPECLKVVDQVNEWGNLNNQQCEVVICQSALKQKLLKQIHQKLPNVETEFFQDESLAWLWLQSRGFIAEI